MYFSIQICPYFPIPFCILYLFLYEWETNPDNKKWVQEQFTKLSSYTLLEPSKVTRILENMFNSEMSSEIESTIKNLYRINPDEVAANELMATYYRNVGDVNKEIQTRESLRSLDPKNYVLELQLAKVYASQRLISRLNLFFVDPHPGGCTPGHSVTFEKVSYLPPGTGGAQA